jgi:transcription initiation factor TFIID TATA-box-binding protein
LDLQRLSSVLPDTTYNPEEAPVLVMQFSKPRSVATLSSDGTVSLTGPKSMAEVKEIIGVVRDRLQIAGVQTVEEPEVLVHNTTVSTQFGKPLNLRSLARSLSNAQYHARQFPGLIYRTGDPNTVILLFHSGKIVCNGVTLDEMREPLDALLEKLMSLGV